MLRRSHDGGRSWAPLQIIGDNGPHTFGNPCAVVDARTNTVWLLTTQNRGTDREKDIIAGASEGSRTVWVMRSQDDGASWSRPVEITSSVKAPDWTWYATGPGVGIQTRAGRLVVPGNHAEAKTGIHRSHLFFSDDGGKRWSLGASSDAGTNESQVVELADGRLLLNMRNHPPKPDNFRMIARSDDGGRTLSAAVPRSRADRAAGTGEPDPIQHGNGPGPESSAVCESGQPSARADDSSSQLRRRPDLASLAGRSRRAGGLLESRGVARRHDRRSLRARRSVTVQTHHPRALATARGSGWTVRVSMRSIASERFEPVSIAMR